MEEYNDQTNLDEGLNNTVLSERTKNNFIQSSKWLKILGIIGLVFNSLYIVMIIASFFTPVVPVTGNTFGLIFLLALMSLYLYLTILLIRQSKSIKNSETLNLEDFSENFYSFWKITGVLTVSFVSLMILFMIIGISVGMSNLF